MDYNCAIRLQEERAQIQREKEQYAKIRSELQPDSPIVTPTHNSTAICMIHSISVQEGESATENLELLKRNSMSYTFFICMCNHNFPVLLGKTPTPPGSAMIRKISSASGRRTTYIISSYQVVHSS